MATDIVYISASGIAVPDAFFFADRCRGGLEDLGDLEDLGGLGNLEGIEWHGNGMTLIRLSFVYPSYILRVSTVYLPYIYRISTVVVSGKVAVKNGHEYARERMCICAVCEVTVVGAR